MKKAPAARRSQHIRMALDCFRVPQPKVILCKSWALPSLVTSDFYRFEGYWYIGLTFLSVFIKQQIFYWFAIRKLYEIVIMQTVHPPDFRRIAVNLIDDAGHGTV